MSGAGTGDRWHEGFFEGLALDMWRRAVPPETTRAEVDWLERVLELPPGARVLDVPLRSVERGWSTARAWLHARLRSDMGGGA